ncbi:methylglyoxal reductase (NADPH-dependent) gre2 [Tulasnella sp. 331]|nr:methylglyoxal reductase (NADPH-dependent) gre2 [Tulasnella sp. 331]
MVEGVEKVDSTSNDGAFDQVVVGVDAVQCMASPFHFKADDPQEFTGPAVSGTVGVLEGIKKNAPGVKRVVIASSVASIIYDKSSEIFNKTGWNATSPNEVKQKGKGTSAVHKYRASKVLVERAA